MVFSSKKGLAQRNKCRTKSIFRHNSEIWHMKFMASSRTIPRNLVDGIDTSSDFPFLKCNLQDMAQFYKTWKVFVELKISLLERHHFPV